ncbi:MAG: recombinase family protein [Chloroflexota bacterium]|nr:recombinase family protein [Chloroflexota bacterium]
MLIDDRLRRGAIWARVSTEGQQETSIPSQISRCREKLESAGYTVIHTIQTHWTSLDLYSCPQFQELRSLILNKEIDGLAIFDRDRLDAKGLQRLVFLAECRESGVQLLICQGPSIINEPEGQLVELALAIGKERSVLRTSQGSRDGLYDRAVKRRLPTSHHKLYGYRWEGDQRLVPNEDYPAVKLIFEMALSGSGYHGIVLELKRRGILSPAGRPEWNKAVLSALLHNPTYTGKYFALKKKAVAPDKRRGNTYGNSSCRKLPLDQCHYIKEIEIVDPPITWSQRETILNQIAIHMKLAQRNAKRDYLLRGFIECPTHTGVKGEPRKYHGTPKRDTYCYVCPVGKCAKPFLNGPELEEVVKGIIVGILIRQPEDSWNKALSPKTADATRKQMFGELDKLRRRREANLDKLVKLEERVLSGTTEEEVASRLRQTLRAEQTWINSEETAKRDQLAQLGKEEEAARAISDLRNRMATNLVFDHLGVQQWRDILTTLNVKIHPRVREEKLQFFEELMARVGIYPSGDLLGMYGLKSLHLQFIREKPYPDAQSWLDSYEKRKVKELTMADIDIQMAIAISPKSVMNPSELPAGNVSNVATIALIDPGRG